MFNPKTSTLRHPLFWGEGGLDSCGFEFVLVFRFLGKFTLFVPPPAFLGELWSDGYDDDPPPPSRPPSSPPPTTIPPTPPLKNK